MDDRESWAQQFDLFEVDGGHRVWCTQIIGLMHAGSALRKLSAKSPNECIAVRQPANEVVARLNIPAADLRAPHVFQITYDPKISEALAQELPAHGYRFSYAAGGDLACAILTSPMECNAFILGYAATIDVRRGMAHRLNVNYPDVPIVALKSPSEPALFEAHFSVELDGNEALLTTLAEALNTRPGD